MAKAADQGDKAAAAMGARARKKSSNSSMLPIVITAAVVVAGLLMTFFWPEEPVEAAAAGAKTVVVPSAKSSAPDAVFEACENFQHWGFMKGERLNRCLSLAKERAAIQPSNVTILTLVGEALLFYEDRDKEAISWFERALEIKQYYKPIGRKYSEQEGTECADYFQSYITALLRSGNENGATSALQKARDSPACPAWVSSEQLPEEFDPNLRSHAYWPKSVSPIVQLLEDNFGEIRGELDNMIEAWGEGGALFKKPAMAAKTLQVKGSWTDVTLKLNDWRPKFCEVAMPKTCGLLRDLPMVSGYVPGKNGNKSMPYVKVYRQEPKTHLRAHYGMTNARLQMHLALKIPGQSTLRVGHENRSWEEGKVIIFDDSFDHEAWHEHETEARYVLNVGFWHPDLWDQLAMPEA